MPTQLLGIFSILIADSDFLQKQRKDNIIFTNAFEKKTIKRLPSNLPSILVFSSLDPLPFKIMEKEIELQI